MRILKVSGHYCPGVKCGGPLVQIHSLRWGLLELGHHFQVVMVTPKIEGSCGIRR